MNEAEKIVQLEKARDLALRAHGDQKYGDKPYMYHVESVVKLVDEYFRYGYQHKIVAYLHDVPEDTDVNVCDIRKEFGDKIANWVSLLTDCDGANRKERKRLTNQKLKSAGLHLLMGLNVKILDRMANTLESINTKNKSKFKMYDKEYVEFKDAVSRDENKILVDDLDEIMKRGRKLFNENKLKP